MGEAHTCVCGCYESWMISDLRFICMDCDAEYLRVAGHESCKEFNARIRQPAEQEGGEDGQDSEAQSR